MFQDEKMASISLPTLLTTTRSASTLTTFDDTIQNLSRSCSAPHLIMPDGSSGTILPSWAFISAADVFRTISSRIGGSPILCALLCAVLCVVASKTYKFWIYPHYVSPLRRLPGPTDNRFPLGQLYKYIQVTWVPNLYLKWLYLWPDTPFIRFLGLFNVETLLASSITSYKEILTTKNAYFIKPDLARQAAKPVIGDGLPFAEGHLHRQRRAFLNKPFAINRIKPFVPKLQKKAKQLTDFVIQRADHSGEVEIETSCWKAVLDVIGIEVLGKDFNHLEDDNAPFHNLFSKTMQQTFQGHIVHFFDSYIPLRRILPSSMNDQFVESCQKIRQHIMHHVTQRRAVWNRQEPQGKKSGGEGDVLQYLIEQGPAVMSDHEVAEYALNLMVLGHDTTACTIVWCIHMLSRHQDIQKTLREEIKELLKGGNTQPAYNEIDQLKYLDNFINEVLRVYCPVAYIPREATSDVEIAGVLLPKGTIVNLSPAMMNMNPAIWGEDVGHFKPDRWNKRDKLSGDAYAFESFHNGPRHCIGKRLSLMELKVMLIELVSRIEIDHNGGPYDLPFACPSFTLRPAEKLRVKIKVIEQTN